MAWAPSGRLRLRFRKATGIVLIVLGGLWSLLWAAVWYAIWAFTGAGGVLLLALDWRFLGPTALGVAVLAVGIRLADGVIIYIVRLDGAGLRKVTRNLVDDSNPSGSPDGRRLVFDRTDYERDRRAIVVVDLTTGAETEFAHSDDDFVSEPAWQPGID